MNNIPEIYGSIDGPIVIIGFGSIGRGVLPLIKRHFNLKINNLYVIDPNIKDISFLKNEEVNILNISITESNFREILSGIFYKKKGFCVNLSVDVSSLDIMKFCREFEILYIDTVVEPWKGFYFGNLENANRTNYVLRESVRAEKELHPGGSTAISCCGANPGMVSWFVKEALLLLSNQIVKTDDIPSSREEWALLMKSLGVKGIHIAERDSQKSRSHKPINTFINTWSVEGFIAEGFQPAELGWGTHEKWFPENGHTHSEGCQAAIWLERPGAMTKVHSWCPTSGPQYGFLITHNESISISDYYTIGSGQKPEYRPTCLYAYHPCDDAVLSLHETFGSGMMQEHNHILDEKEITEGMDELGVLLYGHQSNALWYGSRLTIDDTRRLAPYQNATGLQVSSAILAGMVWAIENPKSGIVETDEMDHKRCLEIQKPYLGSIETHYTNWTPLTNRWIKFSEEIDESDPWQFKNILASYS